MSMLIFVLSLFSLAFANVLEYVPHVQSFNLSDNNLNRTDLKCMGRPYNVFLTAYYPVLGKEGKRKLDFKGAILNTLQDYLDGRNSYVTVAGNIKSGIPYETKMCIEELNEHFGRRIPFEVRDIIKNETDLLTPDFSELKICVRTEKDTHDTYVNCLVTARVEILNIFSNV